MKNIWGMTNEDICEGEEKKVKTGEEVDDQCKIGLDGERTVGGKTQTRDKMRWKNTQLTALRYPQNWPLYGCTNAHNMVM